MLQLTQNRRLTGNHSNITGHRCRFCSVRSCPTSSTYLAAICPDRAWLLRTLVWGECSIKGYSVCLPEKEASADVLSLMPMSPGMAGQDILPALLLSSDTHPRPVYLYTRAESNCPGCSMAKALKRGVGNAYGSRLMCMEAGVSSRLRPLLAISVHCVMQMLVPKGAIFLSGLHCHQRHALLCGV